MIKKRKCFNGGWKNTVELCILSVLSLFVPFVSGSAIAGNEGSDGEVRKSTGGEIREAADAGSRTGGDDAKPSGEVDRLKREVEELRLKLETKEAEKSAAQAELGMVRNGLGELLEKLQEKDRELQSLQLKFAVMLETGVQADDNREVQLMSRLTELSRLGDALARSAADFCKQADSLVDASGLDEVQKAQLSVAREAFLGELRKFSVAAGGVAEERTVDRTRIFAVERDLGLVVLPVGINHGAFQGLVLYGIGKDPLQVRIVSVRPFVSGAVVIKGDIADVSPGMELVADVNKIK